MVVAARCRLSRPSATSAAIASRIASISEASLMSAAKVRSVERLLRSRVVWTGRSSMPRARSKSTRPHWPKRAIRRSNDSLRSSATVVTPSSASERAADGPTPKSLRTGSGARKASTSLGLTTVRPSGLL